MEDPRSETGYYSVTPDTVKYDWDVSWAPGLFLSSSGTWEPLSRTCSCDSFLFLSSSPSNSSTPTLSEHIPHGLDDNCIQPPHRRNIAQNTKDCSHERTIDTIDPESSSSCTFCFDDDLLRRPVSFSTEIKIHSPQPITPISFELLNDSISQRAEGQTKCYRHFARVSRAATNSFPCSPGMSLYPPFPLFPTVQPRHLTPLRAYVRPYQLPISNFTHDSGNQINQLRPHKEDFSHERQQKVYSRNQFNRIAPDPTHLTYRQEQLNLSYVCV